MNILLAAAELAPFAKTGGLADITSALPRQWKKYGQNPIIILPKYRQIDVDKWGFKKTDKAIFVPMNDWVESGVLWKGYLPETEIPVYLVEYNEYFDRPGIYGEEYEYFDNDRRFIFFSRAIFEAAKALDFKPDIIHAHDFHTGFAMAFLKSYYNTDLRFANTAGVFTIHNLAYQGKFNAERALHFSGFGMEQFFEGSWFAHENVVNAMKTGIMFADKITTVSPNYSKEIRMPYFGEGLHGVLNHRGADLVGILNGVDYNVWNPLTDSSINHNYDINSIENKSKNKYDYLKGFGLIENDDLDLPLIGMVTRLAEQKGIDIMRYGFEDLIEKGNFRFTIIGSGEKEYEDYFLYLQDKFPKLVHVTLGYEEDESHRVLAASDYFLIPSRFEPCGLTQIYAVKYGTIPIVRSTGGLADTVSEYQRESGLGNGFSFNNYDCGDMNFAIERALSLYKTKPHWDTIRKNAMSADFSASHSAMEYLKAFKWALAKQKT